MLSCMGPDAIECGSCGAADVFARHLSYIPCVAHSTGRAHSEGKSNSTLGFVVEGPAEFEVSTAEFDFHMIPCYTSI